VVYELCATPVVRAVHRPIRVYPRQVVKMRAAACEALSKNFTGLTPAQSFAGIFDDFGAGGNTLSGKNSQTVNLRRRYSQFETTKLRNPLLRQIRHRSLGSGGQRQRTILFLGARHSIFWGHEFSQTVAGAVFAALFCRSRPRIAIRRRHLDGLLWVTSDLSLESISRLSTGVLQLYAE
jgi:hypothetical protein